MNFIPKITYTELVTATPKTVTFDSPPEGDPFGESYKTMQSSSRSSAGVKQTQYNYTIKSYALNFNFQSETVKDAFEDFYLNHASKGGTFKYFPSSDEVDFETFELSIRDQKFSRPIPSATPGEYEYDFRLSVERVL